MPYSISRRKFIAGIGALAASSSLPEPCRGNIFEPPFYPEADLTLFDDPITPAPSKIEFGCASITWNGDDLQAIKDISALGYRGIQLRANILEKFGDRPRELRGLLERNHLVMVALSSGSVGTDQATEAETIRLHTRHARFAHDAGGRYLQLVDSARPRGRDPVAEDYRRLGRILTEISKRAVDLGLRVGYHNHMDSLGEAPDEIDRVLEAADPRYVKLELDTAHYYQGGGDPARAIIKYRDRLLFLHLKDVESLEPAGGKDQRHSYRFVELGRGRVDLPGVFKSLDEIKFRGWCVVELDRVPDASRTPKESALMSKKYLEEKLGIRI